MSKKAATLPMRIVVVAVILLVVLVVYLGVFQGLFKKEGNQINKQIDNLDDYDNDGVINMFDKCCCTDSGKIDDVGSNGCLSEETPTALTKDCSKCK